MIGFSGVTLKSQGQPKKWELNTKEKVHIIEILTPWLMMIGAAKESMNTEHTYMQSHRDIE